MRAAAKPVRIVAPSFRFTSCCTRRMRGSASESRRTISAERSVEASLTTTISKPPAWRPRASTAQAMACSMFSSSLNIGMTRETVGRIDMAASLGDLFDVEELDGQPADVGTRAGEGGDEDPPGAEDDVHGRCRGEREHDAALLPPGHLDEPGGAAGHEDRDGARG